MRHSGIGLGMSVVWGTIKDHKGFIDLTIRVGTDASGEEAIEYLKENTIRSAEWKSKKALEDK